MQEEREEWRNRVDNHSIQMMVLREPEDFEDLFVIFGEMMGAVGNHAPFTEDRLNQFQQICAEASAEYGKTKAFWLMIESTSLQEMDLGEELEPGLAEIEDIEWNSADEAVAAFMHASYEHRKTVPPDVLRYYDEELSVMLEIYFPPDYESAKGFME